MDIEIDWTDCDLVERIPGKMGGEPVIKGTRVRAETIIKTMTPVSRLTNLKRTGLNYAKARSRR
jgi:Protein of unknown function (DUF433)